MDTIKVKLKDPASTFEEAGKVIKYREIMSFPNSERVKKAIRVGVLQVVKDQDNQVIAKDKDKTSKSK